MLLSAVALQAITVIEFVARRNLAAYEEETLSGLVAGNPHKPGPPPHSRAGADPAIENTPFVPSR